MCKRQVKLAEKPARQSVSAYTGETINLGSERSPAMVSKPRQCAGNGFPFWTLWLLWPLFGLIKSGLPIIAGSVLMLSQFVVPLLPVVLIVIGIVLLRRS